MILYTDHQWRLNQFIETVAYGDLQKNAIRAASNAGIQPEDYGNYLVITIDGYQNIVEIEREPDYPDIELPQLKDKVYPFDEKRIYPTQKIKQEIRYTTL